MKATEDFYKIGVDVSSGKKQFLSLADLHYGVLQQMFYKGTMKKFFDYLIRNNKDATAILIPGDLLFYLTSFHDKKFLAALINDLKDFVDKLGAPVFISYGNHDLPLNEEKLKEEEKQELDLGYYLDNRGSGIYVLDNEQVKFQDVVITGFSPRRDAYSPNAMPSCLKSVKECFDKCNFHFSKGTINVLMSHENKFFTHPSIVSEYGDLYDYLTFIIGGHLHDGYMPIWLQQLCKESMKDYGIWEKVPPKINMCRGAFKVSKDSVSDVILPKQEGVFIEKEKGECISIVNRGVAKYSWFLPSRPSYTKIEVTGSFYMAEDGTYWTSEEDYKLYRQENEQEKVKK